MDTNGSPAPHCCHTPREPNHDQIKASQGRKGGCHGNHIACSLAVTTPGSSPKLTLEREGVSSAGGGGRLRDPSTGNGNMTFRALGGSQYT